MLNSLFRKKSIAQIQADAAAGMEHEELVPGQPGEETITGLRRSLGTFDLTMLGIAAIIGAGIFAMVGNAANRGGPAVILLFVTAVSNALYGMLTRKLAGDSPYTTLFYSALVGTLVLTPFVPFAIVPSAWSWTSAGLFVLLGLLAGIGHSMVTRAFLRAPATLLAPFSYVTIVWAVLFGYVLFDQLPDAVSFVGMTVIVASGLARAWQERRRARAALRVP